MGEETGRRGHGRLNPRSDEVCYSRGKDGRRRSHTGRARVERAPRAVPPGPEEQARFQDAARSIMEQLTRRFTWSYDRFRRVLVASAVLEHDIPAAHRPDYVDLGKLAEHVALLGARTAKDGRAWCRVFLVDIEKRTLIQGKTTSGSPRSVVADWSKQRGREAVQKRSFSIHIHPLFAATVAQGFSDTDYGVFLHDREQRAMIMGCGDSLLMILQTTATPFVFSPETTKARIDSIEQDTIGPTPGSRFPEKLVDFNREVCVQFALTLYVGGEDGRMKRTQVV